MSHAKAIEITDDNFDAQAIRSDLPVLIDFTAAWCPPCRAIAPHVEAIASAYQGRVRVGTCDVDANPELTAKLASLPGVRIHECSITYHGRTYAEGKKITWRDGFRALWCIVRYARGIPAE